MKMVNGQIIFVPGNSNHIEADLLVTFSNLNLNLNLNNKLNIFCIDSIYDVVTIANIVTVIIDLLDNRKTIAFCMEYNDENALIFSLVYCKVIPNASYNDSLAMLDINISDFKYHELFNNVENILNSFSNEDENMINSPSTESDFNESYNLNLNSSLNLNLHSSLISDEYTVNHSLNNSLDNFVTNENDFTIDNDYIIASLMQGNLGDIIKCSACSNYIENGKLCTKCKTKQLHY
jgi:hypothetical protein